MLISVNGVFQWISSSLFCAPRLDLFTLRYTDIVCVNVSPASYSAVKYSEQDFSGSCFNLQVGQLPVLTELFIVP